MKSVKVYLYVSAPPEPTDPQYVCDSHMKIRWGRHRQNTHLPNSPAGCIEIRPDLKCSPSKTTAARDAEWTSTSKREWQRGRERCSWLLWGSTSSAQMWTVCDEWTWLFLAARSAGCPRTTDTGHRIVQRRVRRIETRGTENRRGEGGWQAFSQLRKKGSKNVLTHTHNTLTYTDSNNATCNEDLLATLYVWLLKIWIRLSAMKTCLQTVNV